MDCNGRMFCPLTVLMQLCALMPDISETYIELVVGRMVKEGCVERIGPKNSSRYVPRGRAPRIGRSPKTAALKDFQTYFTAVPYAMISAAPCITVDVE